MTLVLELSDTWTRLLGLDSVDAPDRALEMLVIESYREGRLSRGQVAEMLGLGFHETERLLRQHDAEQQPTWDELERSSEAVLKLMKA